MILVGTPKGMANIFYDYYQKAQADPRWFIYKAKTSETGIVDKEELMLHWQLWVHQYEQEFECSFIETYKDLFMEILLLLDDKKQITRVPVDPAYPVNTAWDLGFNDQTAIFFQQIGHNIHIVDYYENKNEAFPHYAQILKEKDYVYEHNYGPHDLDQTEFGTGKTRERQPTDGLI